MSQQASIDRQVCAQVSNQVGRRIYARIRINAQVSGAVLDSIVWYHRGDPLQQAWDRVRKQAEEDTDG